MAGFDDEVRLSATAAAAGVDGQRHEQAAAIPLAFPQVVIQRIREEIGAGEDIAGSELPQMHGYHRSFEEKTNVAALAKRISRIREDDSSDEDHTFRGRGFAVAHRALRYAVGVIGQTLPEIHDELVR